MKTKVELKNLQDNLPSNIDLFICMVSYEERTNCIVKNIFEIIDRAIIFSNREHREDLEENLNSCKNYLVDKFEYGELSLSNPTSSALEMKSKIHNICSDITKANILVDITTFTHEQLLILFAILYEYKSLHNLYFSYTGADWYSTNTEIQDVWLSKGVVEIRSILGYPGIKLPTNKLHLVILFGFEYERANKLIEQIEPSILSIGIGTKEESIHSGHYEKNAMFFERLDSYLQRQRFARTNLHQFEFSCTNPNEAQDNILSHINKFPNNNNVICPMNTKLSTLGAGLAALAKPEIQLLYAQPIEYNVDGYSTPSNLARLFQA